MNEKGVFMGRTLIQEKGSIGGSRFVFVKLQGVKNELVFPTFGAVLQNPFKFGGKIFAGDLMEYRTDENGLNPKVFLLKTFEVAATVESAATTVTIVNDGYRHVPAVGDNLMVAPASMNATGTAVTVTAVVADDKKWTVTLSATLGALAKGTILVEAAEAGSGKKMLVQAINAVAPSDYDCLYDAGAVNPASVEYNKARYILTPALGGLMYTNKMSPMPACVKALNKCNVNGWFKVEL